MAVFVYRNHRASQGRMLSHKNIISTPTPFRICNSARTPCSDVGPLFHGAGQRIYNPSWWVHFSLAPQESSARLSSRELHCLCSDHDAAYRTTYSTRGGLFQLEISSMELHQCPRAVASVYEGFSLSSESVLRPDRVLTGCHCAQACRSFLVSLRQ